MDCDSEQNSFGYTEHDRITKMLTPNKPKVSVIIPTYNRAQLLSRAVNSVLSQTFTDYEILIVDDHSSDNTQDMIADFSDLRIRSIRHRTNLRQSAAINTGIANARGDYVAFLDDDDVWLPNKLRGQIEILDSSEEDVGLVYGWLEIVNHSTGCPIGEYRLRMEGNIFEELVALNSPGQPSVLMARTSIAKEVGGFGECLTRFNDTDFILRISQRYKVALIPEVVARAYVSHGHEQMGHDTPQNMSAAVEYMRSHLSRFAAELDKRPRAQATVLRRLASVEIMRGNHRTALAAIASAFRLDPVDVSRAILSNRALTTKTLTSLLRRPSA